MRARVVDLAYCLASFAMILMHKLIFSVEGQSTAQVCENGDSSNSIAAELIVEEIGQLNMQLHDIREILTESNQKRKSQQDNVTASLQDINIKQEQIIKEFINNSVHLMKNQLGIVVTSLQAVDRRSQEQDIYRKRMKSSNEFLNASLQQMKSQQDTIITSIEAIDRRSQEQDIYSRKVQTVYELLNTSYLQMKSDKDVSMGQLQTIHEFLNASSEQIRNHEVSFQELKDQLDNVTASLQTIIDRRSQDLGISIRKVQSSNEFLNVSFQQMKNQLNTAVISLHTNDRRSQNQIESIQLFLNESLRKMKNMQDTLLASIEAVDRRSQEQDIVMRKVQSIGEFLNASLLQQKYQQDTVLRKLEAYERRLHAHDLSLNQTQNSWKLEIAYGTDVGEVPILPSIVNNWIVIMHRFDGSLDFFRNWNEYKNGFGDMRRGEFWVGNEKIHRLTNRFNYTLRIEVQVNVTGQWFYGEYATFSLDSESNKYALRVSGYSGNAGDALTGTPGSGGNHNGRGFSTKDADNDRDSSGSCAQTWSAGWWFDSCWESCLTCPYRSTFYWGVYGSLRSARMMIKSI